MLLFQSFSECCVTFWTVPSIVTPLIIVDVVKINCHIQDIQSLIKEALHSKYGMKSILAFHKCAYTGSVKNLDTLTDSFLVMCPNFWPVVYVHARTLVGMFFSNSLAFAFTVKVFVFVNEKASWLNQMSPSKFAWYYIQLLYILRKICL